MNLSTQIAGYQFESCLMNASGVHCQTREQLDELLASASKTFVTKTATLRERSGNPEPRFKGNAFHSINSMGLPNKGIDYYLDYLTKLDEKSLFLSTTGLSKEEIYKLLDIIEKSEFQGLIELNLSCPNVVGRPQTAYDFPLVNELLNEIFTFFTKPLGVKLPPYFDLVHFDQMADILNKYPLKFITTINSIGNGLWIEDETVVIQPKQGFGGLGGQDVQATALANVHAFYQRLNSSIQIIGVGGVYSGEDAFKHILCGASMVQIGTALAHEGPDMFERVADDLLDIMKSKGYQKIEDFRGKLKYIEE